jgi:hypothetical protein
LGGQRARRLHADLNGQQPLTLSLSPQAGRGNAR